MGFARAIFALIVIGAIGLVGYQIGVSQTIATQLPAGAAPVAYYGYPYGFGFGFGFLGFLFPLFFLFLIFGLLRAAMFGGRGGWGHKGGAGYMGRGAWGDGRARIEELHRELHGEKPTSGGPTSGTYGGPSGPAT